MKEEKDAYTEQVAMLQHQVETQNNVVRKLEEKERILQTAIATLEKELRYVEGPAYRNCVSSLYFSCIIYIINLCYNKLIYFYTYCDVIKSHL